ncbi:hypothetical protein FB45DRAFT_929413 [Roridomyces roridus]|uniref:Adenylate kinase n=1 Tax=Roridomyces roridus TaxID=1738132 RepID=A0AAD7FEW6_9AGAR|nr:hypothetical protein FB45DRAFT_929413 [Roridomyces roridus]
MVPPPLLGDAEGKYRVHIVGNSGTGKSTSGERLANLLGVPFISLDTYFYKSGWEESTTEEMRANVAEAFANAPNGWVADGNYTRRLGSIIEAAETDIIWLDPPLSLYLPRIIWRTVLRLLHLAPQCKSDCDERLSTLFSKNSIVWWCFSQHWNVRKREGEKMQKIGVDIGTDVGGRKMRRLGGWGGELERWFADVAKMVQSK